MQSKCRIARGRNGVRRREGGDLSAEWLKRRKGNASRGEGARRREWGERQRGPPKSATRRDAAARERGNEASEQTERASIFAGLDAATEGDAPLLANTLRNRERVVRVRTLTQGAGASASVLHAYTRSHKVHSRESCLCMACMGCTMQLRARPLAYIHACVCLCMCTGVSAPAQRGDRRPGPTRERSTLTSPNDRRRCTLSPLFTPHPSTLSAPSAPLSSHRTLPAKSHGRIRCAYSLQSARVGFDDGEVENAGAGLTVRNLCLVAILLGQVNEQPFRDRKNFLRTVMNIVRFNFLLKEWIIFFVLLIFVSISLNIAIKQTIWSVLITYFVSHILTFILKYVYVCKDNSNVHIWRIINHQIIILSILITY